MINRKLTIIINTFNSSDVIFRCLNSISPNYKVLVIENSNDIHFKKKLEEKYKNLKCYLTRQNLGYAKGNNFGLKLVKTKYALILNPDAVLKKDSLKKFFFFTKKIKDFSIVGPSQKNLNNLKNKKKPYEANIVKGFAMFLNIPEFKKIGFFDKNFFIYCEEIDLCKRLKDSNKKIFIDPSIQIRHLGGKSHNKSINIEMELSRNWHWLWSQFYFNQKHYGYYFSILKFTPKIVSTIFRILFYYLIFDYIRLKIYQQRLSGLYNSVIGRKSWFRPKV